VESNVMTSVGSLVVSVRGRGPIAVLWHSLFVDNRLWRRVEDALAGQRRLVQITGPAHGRSASRRQAFTLEDCATAARQVLDALGITEPVDWVGCAWGGHVGLVLAARHPERIRSLAAFNAPVAALSPAEAKPVRLLASVLATFGPIGPARRGVASALLSERSRAEDADAVDYVEECLVRADPKALANAIRSISLSRPDIRTLLPTITMPTLLVTTNEDPLWTPEAAIAAAATMPNAVATVVAGGAHLTPMESPDETIALVTDLWAASEPASPVARTDRVRE
jgi:pimeloyl-ACP methyl ester carboxylesterase